MKRCAAALWLLVMTGATAAAHDILPGFWELRETSPGVYAFLWKLPTGPFELDVAPVFPEGCRVEDAAETPTPGSVLRHGTLRCESGLAGKTFALRGATGNMIDVLLRVAHRDGRVETYLLGPASPSVTLNGGRAGAFLRLGVKHILLGVDHLLFVLGLVLLVRGRWPLLKTITAFTVAHSLTLAAAAFGIVRVPRAPVEAAIALSILLLGAEVVRARRGETSLTIRHPWLMAFAFGLLHGFGFASGLAIVGLPRAEIPQALFLFNVGVEVGQVAFVFLVILLEQSFRVLKIRWPRVVRALPGYGVGSLGAFWTIQRVALLFGR